MNTNMTGVMMFSQNLFVLVLWNEIALALEGLKHELVSICNPYSPTLPTCEGTGASIQHSFLTAL